MGYYHFVMGIGTLFIIAILWAVLGYTNDILSDKFYNMTPAHFGNYTVNQTAVRAEFTNESNVFFYSIFFLVIIIFAWIILKAMQERDFRRYYGG